MHIVKAVSSALYAQLHDTVPAARSAQSDKHRTRRAVQVAWSAVKILGLDATALDASKAGEDPKYTVELPGTLA